jgi:hypothetical protein
MAQSAPIRTNDTDDTAAALEWAQVAGLVEIRLDGSWSLTPQGFAGMLTLFGEAHPFNTRPAEHDSGRRYRG